MASHNQSDFGYRGHPAKAKVKEANSVEVF